MRLLSLVLFTCVALAALPAIAQSTNATPVLVFGTADFDPTGLTFTGTNDAQNLKDYVDNVKTATGNSVLTAGADFNGVDYYFTSPTNPGTVADAARIALELCEFTEKSPCIILAINGKDARQDGAWPAQPRMLMHAPGSRIDPWSIPFNTQYNRAIGGWLTTAASPEAVVLSTGGGWSASGGATMLEAIDSAFATCAKSYPSNVCVLYAVDGTVVFTP
jgi:hypothetical protein